AENLAENGGVRTLGHAIHAAGAVFGDVFGNLRSDVAEIAQRGSPSGHQGPGQRQVGRQLFLPVTLLVAAYDALVEIENVQNGQANQLVAVVYQGAIAVVVKRVLLGRLVH